MLMWFTIIMFHIMVATELNKIHTLASHLINETEKNDSYTSKNGSYIQKNDLNTLKNDSNTKKNDSKKTQ